MKLRLVSRATMLIFAIPLIAQSQTAQVTFYSNASIAKRALPSSQSAFYGYIFDGATPLANLEHDHFITFILQAGSHIFSASYSKHPASSSQLSISLAPDQHYFIQVSANLNTYALKFPRGILQSIDCASAQSEAGNTKPVEPKHVAEQSRAELLDIKTFPHCDS